MQEQTAPEIVLVANKSEDEELLCDFINSLFCWSPADGGGRWSTVIGEYQPCDERKYTIEHEDRLVILNRRQISAEIELCHDKKFGALFRSVLFVLDGIKPTVGEAVIINRLRNAVIVFTQQWLHQVVNPNDIPAPTQIFKGTYKKEIIFGKKVAEKHIAAFMNHLKDIPGVVANREKKIVTILGTDLQLKHRQKMMAVVREFRGVIGDENWNEGKGGMMK
jgi:hypothetical protein